MGSLLNIYFDIYMRIYILIFFLEPVQTRTYSLSDLVPYKEKMLIIGLLPVGKRGLIFSLALGFLSVSVHEPLLLTRTLMTSQMNGLTELCYTEVKPLAGPGSIAKAVCDRK